MTPSQLRQKVEEWRAKRAQKIAERLQLHSKERREVSSMVLGLVASGTKIALPTPPAITRSTTDVRVTSAPTTMRRSSSCGDIQKLQVLQSKKCLNEKVLYPKHKPLKPSSIPKNDRKKQTTCSGLRTKETSSKIKCNQPRTPKHSTKKNETKVLVSNCGPSSSGKKSISEQKQAKVVIDLKDEFSSSSNSNNLITDVLITAETEADLNSTFIIGNSGENPLTHSSNPTEEVILDSVQTKKKLEVTFADTCEIIEPNHALLEDSPEHVTKDIFVDAVSDVEVNGDPSYFSTHGLRSPLGCSPIKVNEENTKQNADTAEVHCFDCYINSDPSNFPQAESESLINKENSLPQNEGQVSKPKLDQPIMETKKAVSLKQKSEEDISEKLGELFVTPSKEIFVTPKLPRKSRALVDSSNIVSSTSIAFVPREVKNKENPEDSKVILTPVRRSTRLRSVDSVNLSAQKLSPKQLMNAQLVPNPYLKT